LSASQGKSDKLYIAMTSTL